MTEIRQPYGSGLGGVEEQPGIGKPEGWEPAQEALGPVAPAIDTSEIAGPGAIQPQAPKGAGSADWWKTQRIDPFRSERIMSEEGVGHVGQLPTFEWSLRRLNPRNLTAGDPRFPLPLQQLTISDLPTRGEGGKLGSINLDYLAPENFFEEVAAQFGIEGGGNWLEYEMRSRDLDPISWEFPSRIMDYGVAFPLAILGSPFGEDNVFHNILRDMGEADPDDQWYRFHQSEGYWNWLSTAGPNQSMATEEQKRQLAYQMARSVAGGSAAVITQKAIETQMALDQEKALGLSTGNARYDWISKTALINTWPGADGKFPEMSEAERRAWSEDVVNKMFTFDPDLPYDRADILDYVLLGHTSNKRWDPREGGWVGGEPETGSTWRPYDTGQQLVNSAAAFSATILPVVGTQIAEFIDPTDRLREAFWRAVDPEQRQQKSGDVMMGTVMSDMGVMIAGGVVIAPFVAGGAAASAGLPARAAYQAWTIGRNVTKVGLITGVSSMAANFALEAASPQYAATTGRMVDMARPVTDSAFSGVVNAAGILTTGSLGVIPTLQVGKHVVKKSLQVGGLAGKFTGAFEPTIVQTFFGGAASRTARMFSNVGMDMSVQELAEVRMISSYLANHSLEAQTRLIFDSLNGVETFTRLDRLSAAAKLKYVEDHIKHIDVQLAAERGWGFLQRPTEPGLRVKLFNEPKMQAYKNSLKAWKALDNEIAQKAVRDYAGYHGATPDAIIESIVNRFKRIQTNFPGVMSHDVDLVSEVAKVGGHLGDDVEELQRAANRAHAIEFHLEHAEMLAAAEGSEEAARIHLIRQRSLTQNDITDELLATLRGNNADAEAAKQALRQKHEVARQLAQKDMTPEELAQFLEDTKPVYAIKRNLPDPGSPTSADPLNKYQERLIKDGEWDIGYVPYVDETIPGIGDRIMPVLPDGTVNAGLRGEVQAITTPPPGWRKVVNGEEFRSTREFIPTVEDGVYVKMLDPTEVGRAVTAPGQFSNPQVTIRFGTKQQIKTVDQNLVDGAQWGTFFDGKGNTIEAPVGHHMVQATDLTGQPIIMRGSNGGATWPVLLDESGQKWLFKAYRSGISGGGPEDLVDLGMGVVETETRIGRLYSMVGLDGAASVPFEWITPGGKDIQGTIQPFYEGMSAVNLAADWGNLTRHQQEQAMGHYMMDWLFSQMDSNYNAGMKTGSFLTNGHGDLVGVDKGQAFRYFGQGDWPPRLGFNPNYADEFGNITYGQYTIQNMLEELRAAGVEFDRGLIEEALQKLESIPEQFFDNEMLAIATARRMDPNTAWTIADDFEFVKQMKDRRLQMRDAMNDLFVNELGGANIPHPTARVKFFRTGRPLEYQPDFGGAQFRNNNVDLPYLQDQAYQASFTEPTAGPDITKAGVVVIEEDGTIWMAEPTGHFDGYGIQSIKGSKEAHETLRDAAVREVYEETGFGVELNGHLLDRDGIRYYIGRRVSGGPANVEKKMLPGGSAPEPEVYNLINAKPRDLQSMLEAGIAKPEGLAREQALMDAILQYQSTGTLPHQIDDAVAGAIGNTGDAAAALPGVSPQTARRYVSYQRLRTGEFIRAPWVDEALSVPGAVSLGNRTYLGGKLDAAFRGFRTWRIAETQRANLFRRMARDYAGITDEQIEVFTRELERIAEDRHIPVQLVGNLNAHALQSSPLVGAGVRKATVDAAEKVFGKTMVNRVTGEVVPVSQVPWRDIIAKSHRQAFKHNFTAGFTSYVYSLPGGWGPAMVGQGLWPTIKFSLSPIFKISEYAESGILNLMRGIRGLPHDIAVLYEPHMGWSRSMIAGEQGLSPYLSGMGQWGRAGQQVTRSAKGGAFQMPAMKVNTAGRLTTWEDALTTTPLVADVSQDGVQTYLHGTPTMSAEGIWPDALPSYTPQGMLPRRMGPDGVTMVNYSPAEWDAARLADSMSHPLSWERYLQTEADIDQALFGLSVLRELGYQRLDQLIDNMPIFHNPGTDWLSRLDFSDAAFQSGPRPTRLESGVVYAEGTERGTLDWGGNLGNMDDSEGVQMLTLQGGQAKYATFGRPEGISRGNASIVLNRSVLKRALITDTDRIGTGFNYGESAMTARGLLQNTRYQLLRNISNMRPGDKLDDVLKTGAYANELAIYEAPTWAEVDAIVFESDEAMRTFVLKLEQAPDEVKQALNHVELRKAKDTGYQTADWGGTAQDMMWERSGLSELRDIEPIMPRDDSLLSLIRPENIPTTQGEAMLNNIRNRARLAGWEINTAPMTSAGRTSVMDDLVKVIDDLDDDIEAFQSRAVRESLRQGEAGTGQRNLFKAQEEKRQAVELWTRINDWYESGTATYTSQRAARQAQSEIFKATGPARFGNIEAFGETRTLWVSGQIDGQGMIDWVMQTPDLVMTTEQRQAFVKALQDELQIEEFTDALRMIKYDGGSFPTGAAVDTWEVFGAKGTVTHSGMGERVDFTAEPMQLNQPGEYHKRAQYVDAQAIQKAMGDRLPTPKSYQMTQTAFPNELRGEILTAEFVDRIRQQATIANNGVDPGMPVIDMYVRGDRDGIMQGPRLARGDVEIVITVRAADTTPIGLTLDEIRQIWMETGLPAQGVGVHPTMGQIGWDSAQQQVMIGGDMDLLKVTLADGSTYLDSGGIQGAPVVFAETFEPGGMAYKSMVGYGDGYFDPSLLRRRTDSSGIVTRRYEATDNSWDWAYDPQTSIIDATTAQEGRIQKDAMEDMRLRDIFDFLRGDGAGRSWRIEVDLNYREMEGALKRAWYRGEIPENAVLVDTRGRAGGTTDEVLDTAYFQNKYGAPDDIRNLKAPRGYEDLPGGPEYIQQGMNQQIADLLGVDVGDIIAGDINALTAKFPANPTPQQSALMDFLRNMMDPIPYKEKLMNAQIMREVNSIFVGVMKTADDPAYKVFKGMGVPDEKITEFLLQDRDLLDQWLRLGRQSDFDALIAHTEKYVSPGKAKESREALDKLYASTDYQTLQQMWRMSIKGAQDEAFGVHFFNPYRSWFERSLNHPIFGIYPLSWSLKAAREWARFLFDNSLLAGGRIRIGMAPAVAINEWNRTINTAVAQNGGDIRGLLSIDGALGDMMMTAGLIMPGDWSSVPFPFSRTIRDIIRGDITPNSMLNDNMIGGFIRDSRLAFGMMQETRDILGNFLPEGTPWINETAAPEEPKVAPFSRGSEVVYQP